MINFESKLPFRMHIGSLGETVDRLYNHIYSNRKDAQGETLWKLYGPRDRMLPFQIFIPIEEVTNDDLYLNDWNLYSSDGFPVLALDMNAITTRQKADEGVWHIYNGTAPMTDYNLPGGYYYFHLNLNSGREIVSEFFYVPCDDIYDDLTKIEYWNTCDFANLIYQGGYKNTLYLEGDLKNKPIIEETGIENGFGEFVQTSSRFVDNYELEEIAPAYIMQACLALRMHNHIEVSQPKRIGTGVMRCTKVTAPEIENSSLFTININFEQLSRLVKGSCCQNKGFTAIIPIIAVLHTIKLNADYATHPGAPSVLIGCSGYLIFAHAGTFTTYEGGSVTIFANGMYNYTPPYLGYLGTDYFSYTIEDALGNTASNNVDIFNGSVVASNDTFTANKASVGNFIYPIGQSVLVNDFIPYNFPVQPIIVGSGATVLLSSIYSANKLLVDRSTGQVTLQKTVASPTLNFDVFNYAIYRNTSLAQSSATITFNYS